MCENAQANDIECLAFYFTLFNFICYDFPSSHLCNGVEGGIDLRHTGFCCVRLVQEGVLLASAIALRREVACMQEGIAEKY